MPWTFLSTGVTFGANALSLTDALVRRVYFPREVPVLGAVLRASWTSLIALALFIVSGPIVGADVTAWWLLAPVLACRRRARRRSRRSRSRALNVYYRDFRYALPFLLQLWLFASPVAYPMSVVPEQWRLPYLTGKSGSRASSTPSAGCWPSAQAPTLIPSRSRSPVSIVVSFLGYHAFKWLEPNFADVI